MPSARGMEAARVKTPQEDSASALTTATPKPAKAMTMMNKMATEVTRPASGLTSARAISASERPPRRMDAVRMTKSWTAPPMHTPKRIHKKPGAKPNCVASTGPMSGPAPEMAAKWWPNSTQRLVAW